MSDQSDIEGSLKGKDGEDDIDRMHLVNQDLNSKIQRLESDILQLKSTQEQEKNYTSGVESFVTKLPTPDVDREATGDGGSQIKTNESMDAQVNE